MMKALRRPRATDSTARPFALTLDRPVIVLGVLVLLLMVLALGCSVATDLTTSTTSVDGSTTAAPTTTTAAAPTTTTIAAATTSTIAATTTTAESTSTTLLPTTTSTITVAVATAETALYEITDWSSGTSGWAAAGQWKTAGGMLVTDGSSDSYAVAPVDLTGHPDYIVECEAQLLDPSAGTKVVLMARLINGTGYWAGFDGSAGQMVVGYGKSALASSSFVLDSNWHKYRMEVRGNAIKLYFEQAEVARAMDNRVLEPGTVGIYCAGGQINVRSFRVVAL
jgi:hypothetical protein